MVFRDYPAPDPEQDIFVSEGRSLTVTVPLLVMETRQSLHRRIDNLAATLKAMMPGPSRGQPQTLERGTRWLFKWKMEGLTQRQIADEESLRGPIITEKQVSKEIQKVTEFLAQYTPATRRPHPVIR